MPANDCSPELIECRMSLSPETVRIINQLQEQMEHASRADTVSMCVRLAQEIISRIDSGARVTVEYPSGQEENLRIDDADSEEVSIINEDLN